ncbi:MAG: hypothetical protein HOC41_01550 [Candidatus Marinimicrobia bacterium]|jgi:hypothetical protein|nr:hypothetical protein [Candidatus Neomarinimicrobiota bacterium]MBT3945523.1 hypothetical protein [Candidatus Neomarinimicrobiota bacterium]MBT4155108.1 hypothetical protein [Candidatus Neomarinimicrobiota bacterium]MBT4554352.1 hypothetical protein [Candidatus Neomarinimicrobiota bacterium]MBT4752085.1 hypothetical protein [Candidatus Neomarinimicrobiota bacterium]|tara:strand:+ start:1393 stop:2313 length:921 start_codon:yes stop_codon:yes gene_type:complete
MENVLWGVALHGSNMLLSLIPRRGRMFKNLSTYLILIGSLLAVDSPRTSVVRTDFGFIDYANRIIVSRGTAEITQKNSSTGELQLIEKNLKLSKGEARARARENLLDLIRMVHFDSRTVGELMVSDRLIESQVESLVGSAYQQGEIEYLERNEVAIALAIKMSGLAEILVDATGYLNEGVAQSAYLMTRAATPKSERTSGVVIDARNIYHIPAMVPKVFNEDDKLVYGPRHYTRSRSVNRGPIGYAHSMDDGNVRRRIGNNPLLVEAVSSLDDINLTVSNMDAERIRDVEKKFGLLTNCKVLVLLK